MLEPTSPRPADPARAPYPSAPGALPARQYYIALAKPTITYALIAAILIMFVATIVYGFVVYRTWNGSQNINVLVDLGAKVNEYIALGEWWRLFTAMFLHIGVMHLLFNLYALYAIGSLVEAYFGHVRFAVIYLLGGLFGSLGSYAFSASISAGASGAIFAIIGAAAVYFFRYRDNFGARGRAVLQNMVLVLAINFAFGLMGDGVDNWGHFGGLVGGALLAWGLLPHYSIPDPAAVSSPFSADSWPASGADGLLAPLSSQPTAMTVRHRNNVEVLWVAGVAVLFVVGFWAATSMHLERLAPLLG